MQTIGIVTIQGRFNYGNRLQNYATQEIYRKKGYLVDSLILNRPLPVGQKVKSCIKKALRKEVPNRELSSSSERLASFDRFNNRINLRILADLSQKSIGGYRFISVGSDQIWSMGRSSYNEDWRFLQFAQPEQRISLSPSFGTDSITCAQERRLTRYLQGYRYLSVREESGAQFIKEASGRDATVICDPTLVLDESEWRRMANDEFTPDNEYVFAYLLGDYSEEAESVLNIASNYGSLPIIRLSDREREGELPAGPAEFISLVKNASWVITDSFHGSVFSALFQRPLTIVHRGGGHAMYSQMFGRLETLAKKLDIEHKIYGSQDFDFSRAADYEGVSEAIECERSKFMEYLEACLSA